MKKNVKSFDDLRTFWAVWLILKGTQLFSGSLVVNMFLAMFELPLLAFWCFKCINMINGGRKDWKVWTSLIWSAGWLFLWLLSFTIGVIIGIGEL